MKLSTSSSLIFATLAISSSTTSMAAPTRDTPDSGLSPSKSRHNLHDPSFHSSPYRAGPRHGRSRSEVRSTASRMSARGNSDGTGSGTPASSGSSKDESNGGLSPVADATGLIDSLMKPLEGLPLVGPLLKAVLATTTTATQNLNTFSVDGSDGASAQALSADSMAAIQAGVAEIQRVFDTASAQNQTASAAPTPSGAAPPPVQSGINKTPLGAVAKSESDANASGWEGFSSAASAPPAKGDAASSAVPTPSASASAAAFDAQAVPAQTSSSSAPSSSVAPAAIKDVQSTQVSASSAPSASPSAAAAAAVGPPSPALPVNPPTLPLPIDALPNVKPSSLPVQLPAGFSSLPTPPTEK